MLGGGFSGDATGGNASLLGGGPSAMAGEASGDASALGGELSGSAGGGDASSGAGDATGGSSVVSPALAASALCGCEISGGETGVPNGRNIIFCNCDQQYTMHKCEVVPKQRGMHGRRVADLMLMDQIM